MVDNCDDPIDREANSVTQLLKQGDHRGAVARLQEDAQLFRPGEFNALVGEVKALSQAADTLSHLEITPICSPNGNPSGRLDVTLITPALDHYGRQYTDNRGQPVTYVEPIAQIDNYTRARVEVCPPIVQSPPLCNPERPWLPIDGHRSQVNVELRLPGFDLGVRLDGGRDYERDRYDRGRWNPPARYECPPVPIYRGGNNSDHRYDNYGGGNSDHRYDNHGGNNNNNRDRHDSHDSHNQTTINKTTVINKIENTTINKTVVNKNETVVVQRPAPSEHRPGPSDHRRPEERKKEEQHPHRDSRTTHDTRHR